MPLTKPGPLPPPIAGMPAGGPCIFFMMSAPGPFGSFFVAAPSSTFDLKLATGGGIPIEERAAAEVLAPLGVPAAPAGAGAYNPAFDVTPAHLIRGLITEHGVISPVTAEEIRRVLGASG